MTNEIIKCNYLLNNIGIDIGNGLTTPILYNNVIPQFNMIEFIIPTVMEKYTIKIYSGNNILSSDNILIYKNDIISPMKVVYIEFIINDFLYYNNMFSLIISTKTQMLLYDNIYFFNKYMEYINRDIDIINYKLKFELKECIEMICIKIKNNEITLPDDILLQLNNKIKQINDMIHTLSNQKLLDIKNNLMTKFFL